MRPRCTAHGFGGRFFFEFNDNLLPNDTHSVMRWYAGGLAGGGEWQAVLHGQINDTK
jgi:hypothetical protein